MSLDNTDITDLAALPNIVPAATDLFAVRRPGSVTPLNSTTGAQVAGMISANLPASGVTASTYGDATHVGQFTVNNQGLITFAQNVLISGGGGSALAIKNFGVQLTAAALSLNFTTGIQVSDDGHGNETISTIFPGVRDYGAKGDGVTDDTTAFVNAAASGGTIYIGAGTYKLTGNVTFPNQVVMLAGASLNIATGIAITFNGTFTAPLVKVFNLTGSGKAAFSSQSQLAVFAEWWGAVTYSAGAFPVASPTFSDVPIQAAINSGAAAVLGMGGDYYIANAVNVLVSNFTLAGVGADQAGQVGGTRICINSATIDGVCVGPATQPPGAGSTWPEDILVRDLTVIRSVAPTSINGNVPGSPTGFRMRWCINSRFMGLASYEHSNGYYVTGCVYSKWIDCVARRNIASNGSGWDYWQGFSVDAGQAVWSYVSGNASVYFSRCGGFNAGGSFSGNTWGMRLYSNFSDTFIDGFESSTTNYGIEATGVGTGTSTPVNEDLKIMNCVMDVCSTYGLYIHNTNQTTQILVEGCYINGTGTASCVYITGQTGMVALTGNQFVAATSGITGINLVATCLGVTSINNIITDCTNPVVMNGCGMCRSEDNINNSNFNATAGVYMTGNAFRCVTRPTINGNANGRVGIGVKVDSGVGYSEVNCSGINTGALASGASGNKLTYGGTQITSTGTFGTTNLAAGVMA